MATKNLEYLKLVHDNTTSIEYLKNRPDANWHTVSIVDEAYHEVSKKKEHLKGIDFLIVKALNHRKQYMEFKRAGLFSLFVIGRFRSFYTPTFKLAQVLANLYVQIGILPNIITITQKDFLSNPIHYIRQFEGGTIIYERG